MKSQIFRKLSSKYLVENVFATLNELQCPNFVKQRTSKLGIKMKIEKTSLTRSFFTTQGIHLFEILEHKINGETIPEIVSLLIRHQKFQKIQKL